MKVFEFISESNWCQRALCIDSEGVANNWPYSPAMQQRCFTGMILYCYRDNDEQRNVLDKVRDATGGNISYWNDRPERTWEQVKDLARELDI